MSPKTTPRAPSARAPCALARRLTLTVFASLDASSVRARRCPACLPESLTEIVRRFVHRTLAQAGLGKRDMCGHMLAGRGNWTAGGGAVPKIEDRVIGNGNHTTVFA